MKIGRHGNVISATTSAQQDADDNVLQCGNQIAIEGIAVGRE